MLFLNYLDPNISLKARLQREFARFKITKEKQEAIKAFLLVLKNKDLATYEHSIRVGLVASRIARRMLLDGKALLYAGILHDIGKTKTRPQTLKKTDGWNKSDTLEMKKHVLDGYEMLRGLFDFSAEIDIWHHLFQSGGYPKRVPAHLHCYCAGTKVIIPFYGRLLSIADCYDALHRVNDKFGTVQPLTGEAIKEKMLELNPDQQKLILRLYEEEVLTTKIFV
jgi:putative nucleotidyltransferase with HDIG domain